MAGLNPTVTPWAQMRHKPLDIEDAMAVVSVRPERFGGFWIDRAGRSYPVDDCGHYQLSGRGMCLYSAGVVRWSWEGRESAHLVIAANSWSEVSLRAMRVALTLASVANAFRFYDDVESAFCGHDSFSTFGPSLRHKIREESLRRRQARESALRREVARAA